MYSVASGISLFLFLHIEIEMFFQILFSYTLKQFVSSKNPQRDDSKLSIEKCVFGRKHLTIPCFPLIFCKWSGLGDSLGS